MDFREFLTESTDLQKTLRKLPAKQRKLVKNYRFKFQDGNTLKNDKKHIGSVDEKKKEIVVAAPWNYSREMAVLHEIGHLVWSELAPEQRKKWTELVRKTPMERKDRQNPEELFSMAYAATYSNRPPEVYRHKSWIAFIKKLAR